LDYIEFYNELEDSLSTSRVGFQTTHIVDEEDILRSLDEAKIILNFLRQVTDYSHKFFKEYPSLESLFEKEYGPYKNLLDRELILETCFVEDFLFPFTESYPLAFEEVVIDELIQNYFLSFKDWCDYKKKDHLEAQETLRENFTLELKPNSLCCQCLKCTADVRAKIRDTAFKEQVEIINKAEEMMFELIVDQKISYLSDYVQKLKKRVDRNLHNIRYNLKRGSLNKLDTDVKAHFKSKFGFRTELGNVYKERLKTFFNAILVDQEVSLEIITDKEFDRFFNQLNIGIWKSPNSLKREFEKVVKSILAYKRKDISATILREYLGQFWIHSDARRKKRKVIYHMGPTNSGKTWNSIEALSKAKHGCYLAPLRLLASELYDTLNEKGVKTNLLTGEEVIEVEGATHYSSTIEMARLNEEIECCVIDEIQMITDSSRGWAWTRALININADEVHLCGDHSVLELVKQILKLTGDTLEIREYERKTSLTVMDKTIKVGDLEKNDALIVFSRRNALRFKMDLENLDFKVSIVYGRLSPEVRREQARKFDAGETDIMVSTDAIAMGMNLPVKRIVFSTLTKYYNSQEHPISHSEIKQIAGRAGRFGRFPEGHTTTLQRVDDGLETLHEALNHNLEQKEFAMVGPDLDIFGSVNAALEEHNLATLSLTEFLRLFNTMIFESPFYCVDLKEMIEVAEMVEGADENSILSDAEIFGFACAPVNLGMTSHLQYFVWILNHYVSGQSIKSEAIEFSSDDIDYLETAIKCVELYQWLARHFDNKNFFFDETDILQNKTSAIEQLNDLLSEKTVKKCSSCGDKLPDEFNFNICENCFGQRRNSWRRSGSRGGSRGSRDEGEEKKSGETSTRRPARRGGKPSGGKSAAGKSAGGRPAGGRSSGGRTKSSSDTFSKAGKKKSNSSSGSKKPTR